MSAHWELLPHFVLRSTGFPFAWIENVAFPDTAAALDAMLDAEDELAALEARLVDAFRQAEPPPLRKLRRTCWEAVRRRRAVTLDGPLREGLGAALVALCERWNAAVAERDARESAARATFERELPERRQALREIAQDSGFQEALWLSSPQMHHRGLRRYLDSWSPGRRRSETRRIEGQLVAYLQRFCAKNDTASFFGPINYGDFAQTRANGLAPGHEHLRHREAFIAYWAVAALASAIGADGSVRRHLRPRRAPATEVDADALRATIAGSATLALSRRGVALLEHVDGERTAAEIAAAAKLDVDAALELLDGLARRRVVVLDLQLPVTALRPLRWLREWVARLPETCPGRTRWEPVLDELAADEQAFARAGLEEKQRLLHALEQRLTEATGRDPRRGEGEFYADRLMIYEECLGGMTPLSLGDAFAAKLHAQLGPVLDAYAAHGVAAHAALQEHGAALLRPIVDGDGAGDVPFLRAAAQLADHELPPPPATRWQQAALEQLAPHAAEREARLDLAALPSLDAAARGGAPLLTSPDLMLVARDVEALRAGDFRIIVSECHDTLMVWGWSLAFHPDRAAVERAAASLFERIPAPQSVANVLPGRRVKILPFEYPGPTIEVGMFSQRTRDRIPAASVRASIEDGRPSLRAAGWPRPLTLANGELGTLAHSIFAPPRVVAPLLDLGAHTPRIVAGDVVVQRERWRVSRADLMPGRYAGSSLELMADVRRAARRLGLPRFCYARLAGEPKPVLVDLDGYFVLELLDHLAGEHAEIELSEMLPGPDELWLTSPRGAFCSELRIGAFYVDGDA